MHWFTKPTTSHLEKKSCEVWAGSLISLRLLIGRSRSGTIHLCAYRRPYFIHFCLCSRQASFSRSPTDKKTAMKPSSLSPQALIKLLNLRWLYVLSLLTLANMTTVHTEGDLSVLATRLPAYSSSSQHERNIAFNFIRRTRHWCLYLEPLKVPNKPW